MTTKHEDDAIIIKRVSDAEELTGIKALQMVNLKSRLDPASWTQQGFVTAEYPIELLQRMHEAEPSVIAKDGDQVIGYTLASTRAIHGGHPLLDDLFEQVDRHSYRGYPLKDLQYLIMGQICVAKDYRGMGLVQRMYTCFRDAMSQKYACCVCDIDRANPRSLKAHMNTGFRVIGELTYGGSTWDIVLWDWRD